MSNIPTSSIIIKAKSANLNFGPGVSFSTGSSYKLIFQTDGNLVLNNPSGSQIWDSNTSNSTILFCVQADGNVVLYNSLNTVLANSVWSTGTYTHTKPGAFCTIQNDGNLVVYDSNNNSLWASGNNGQ